MGGAGGTSCMYVCEPSMHKKCKLVSGGAVRTVPATPYCSSANQVYCPASQNIQCCGQRGDTLHQNQEGVCPDHIMPNLVRTTTSTGWGGELTKGQVQHVGMLWHLPH
jgi:hypothetical protein